MANLNISHSSGCAITPRPCYRYKLMVVIKYTSIKKNNHELWMKTYFSFLPPSCDSSGSKTAVDTAIKNNNNKKQLTTAT